MKPAKDDIEINGTQYKRIIKLDDSGNPIWQKDVPLTLPEIHASGLHIIFGCSENNHYDHQQSGREWKEPLSERKDD